MKKLIALLLALVMVLALAACAAKTEPAKLKWDPTKPMQFTQEEIWEHIHEIEKGPFMTLDEGFKRFEAWKQDLLKSRL